MAPSGGHLLAPSLKASLGAADDSLFAFDTQGAADAVIQARLPALQLAEAARKRYHEGRRARRARKLRRRAGYGDADAERARRLGGGDDAGGSDDDDEASAPELEEWGDDERPPDEMRVVIEGTDNVAAHRRHAAVEGIASGETRNALDALASCCAAGGAAVRTPSASWASTSAGADAVPLCTVLEAAGGAEQRVAQLLATPLSTARTPSTRVAYFRGRGAALAACLSALPTRHGDSIVVQWPPPQDAFPEGCAAFAAHMSATRGVRVYFWPPSRDVGTHQSTRTVRYDLMLLQTLMGALGTTGRVRLLAVFQGSAVAGHAFDGGTWQQLHGMLMDMRAKQRQKGIAHADVDATHLLVDATAVELHIGGAGGGPPTGVGGDLPYAPAGALVDDGLAYGAPDVTGTRIVGARLGALGGAARDAPAQSGIEASLIAAVTGAHARLVSRARKSLAASLASAFTPLHDRTAGALCAVTCPHTGTSFTGTRALVSCDWLRADRVDPHLPSARTFAARLAVARGIAVAPVALAFGRCPTDFPDADHLEDCVEMNAAAGDAAGFADAVVDAVVSLGRAVGALSCPVL